MVSARGCSDAAIYGGTEKSVQATVECRMCHCRFFSASAKCERDISFEGNFYMEVVAKLRDDECGLSVCSDRLIMHVALHYYRTSPKKDK